MLAHAHPPVGVRAIERPALEVADIVRVHGEAFVRAHALLPDQHAVLRAITRCRTAALGGHVDVCDACGHAAVAYNSCRNRHCPKCQPDRARHLMSTTFSIVPSFCCNAVHALLDGDLLPAIVPALTPSPRTRRAALCRPFLPAASISTRPLAALFARRRNATSP